MAMRHASSAVPSHGKVGQWAAQAKADPSRPARARPSLAHVTCCLNESGIASVAMNPSAVRPARVVAGRLIAPIHTSGP